MPTFVTAVNNNQILLDVVVTPIGADSEMHTYTGLLDTGAQRTGISTKVVSDLGLAQVDVGRMQVATGEFSEVALYPVNVGVPVVSQRQSQEDRPEAFVSGKSLIVSGLPHEPWNFDVLLGMDLLSLYHITIVNGQLAMSI